MGRFQSGAGCSTRHPGNCGAPGPAEMDQVCPAVLRYCGDASSDRTGCCLYERGRNRKIEVLGLSAGPRRRGCKEPGDSSAQDGVEPFAQPYRDYDGGEPTRVQKQFAQCSGSIKNRCSTPAHGKSSKNSRLLGGVVVFVFAAKSKRKR